MTLHDLYRTKPLITRMTTTYMRLGSLLFKMMVLSIPNNGRFHYLTNRLLFLNRRLILNRLLNRNTTTLNRETNTRINPRHPSGNHQISTIIPFGPTILRKGSHVSVNLKRLIATNGTKPKTSLVMRTNGKLLHHYNTMRPPTLRTRYSTGSRRCGRHYRRRTTRRPLCGAFRRLRIPLQF